MKIKQALCFDDVLLLPQQSSIQSREEVDLTTRISELKIRLPIISSPMDTVTEVNMAQEMHRHGGLGVLHRYNTIEDQCGMVTDIRESMAETGSVQINHICAAVGASGDFEQRSAALIQAGARILCIDIAHGHHTLMESAIKKLKDKHGSTITIIAGNVATPEGYLELSEWGADAVRIGIGGGSICSTRIQTGHGVPTLQSILDCRDIPGTSIIADGGIKNSGDIVKAIAAGADAVMLGSMLAGTDQSPGSIYQTNTGKQYKVYRGMASPEAQIAWRGNARSLEGISTTIPYKGDVGKILSDMSQNIKSGFSYTGARNISEFQAMAKFIGQTTAGLKESRTHILTK